MTTRISDEQLSYLASAYSEDCGFPIVLAQSLRELQHSRALVTELRALAERMRISGTSVKYPGPYSRGSIDATGAWLSELTSLLAAHDTQPSGSLLVRRRGRSRRRACCRRSQRSTASGGEVVSEFRIAADKPMKLDEKGRCCGRKPIDYKGGAWNSPERPMKFCPRCDREFDRITGVQVPNWAWSNQDGDWKRISPKPQPCRCVSCAESSQSEGEG